MSNYNQSSIIVYPSSMAPLKSYKINSEKNLSNITKNLVRNKVIEGLGINIGGTTVTINPGECFVGGYHIEITESMSLSITGNCYVVINLEWIDESKQFLQGSNASSLYLGVSADLVSSLDSIDSSNPSQVVGQLVLAYVSGSGASYSYQLYQPSYETTLESSDVWVWGNDHTSTYGESRVDDTDVVNESMPLNEYLVTAIISDGQVE